VMSLEMLYHLTLEAASGSTMSLFKQEVDTQAAAPWILAIGMMLAGIVGYRKFQPGYYAVWSDVNAEIVAKQRRGIA